MVKHLYRLSVSNGSDVDEMYLVSDRVLLKDNISDYMVGNIDSLNDGQVIPNVAPFERGMASRERLRVYASEDELKKDESLKRVGDFDCIVCMDYRGELSEQDLSVAKRVIGEDRFGEYSGLEAVA